MSDLRELATKKPVTKADPKDGDSTLKRSKYLKIQEKKMKEFAGKEIPVFLIVESIQTK